MENESKKGCLSCGQRVSDAGSYCLECLDNKESKQNKSLGDFLK